jgi:signal transduction histidine kinase
MNFKEIVAQFNILAQCKKYGLPLWQCPQFLFLIMGIVIVASGLLTYAIGNRYIEDPFLVTLIVLLLTVILFVLAFIIIQSFERLAEANLMKSEFISIVSHQLRSPLSVLRWTLELMMTGKVDSVSPKQLEYFQILKENLDRMQDLVKDLLIVSRIEMAKLPMRKEEFSLEDLSSKLIESFRPFARSSNVEIKFEPEKNLPKAFADPSQIELVIENLLDNAIRYIKGRGNVSIKLKGKKDKIYFEIEDNGVGIPKEDQKYIFQKFFRSRNILKYQTQGTGLGLYIAKSIIGKSGGKIGFESEENKGSKFWFTLPTIL